MPRNVPRNVPRNRIRCLVCNSIVESKTVHDFNYCPCKSCFVDGGREYSRIGGDLHNIRIVKDDDSEIYVKGFEPN